MGTSAFVTVHCEYCERNTDVLMAELSNEAKCPLCSTPFIRWSREKTVEERFDQCRHLMRTIRKDGVFVGQYCIRCGSWIQPKTPEDPD